MRRGLRLSYGRGGRWAARGGGVGGREMVLELILGWFWRKLAPVIAVAVTVMAALVAVVARVGRSAARRHNVDRCHVPHLIQVLESLTCAERRGVACRRTGSNGAGEAAGVGPGWRQRWARRCGSLGRL